ncbi:hypothetical protein GGI22_002230 [Coemansia erecta]|nr:hypothetical protein GGI22_002230 [Coemansia erecta]
MPSMGFAITALALAASVSAHMTFIDPCPRFSPWCTHEPTTFPAGIQPDYSIKNPIPADGILCKSNTPWSSPVATWTAGQSVTIPFYPNGAAHGGGHAQFSVSYDGGKTFAVVYEVLKHMFFNGPSSSNTPEVLSYTFTLPKELPNSDSVIFAWSWVNAIGNREFYMNCADIKVTGSSSSSYTGKQMVIANHNGYPTIPEFGGDYTTGLSYYENSANVTVTGSSAYTSDYNAPKVNTDPTLINVVTTTALPIAMLNIVQTGDTDSDYDSGSESYLEVDPDSESDSGNSNNDVGVGCTHGAMNCASDSPGYEVCVWGTKVSIACGSGTVCKGTNGAIYCGWA